jgi:hypothetical protein
LFSLNFWDRPAYCGGDELDGGGCGVVGPPINPELLLPKPVGCPNELPFVFEFPGCPFNGWFAICSGG